MAIIPNTSTGKSHWKVTEKEEEDEPKMKRFMIRQQEKWPSIACVASNRSLVCYRIPGTVDGYVFRRQSVAGRFWERWTCGTCIKGLRSPTAEQTTIIAVDRNYDIGTDPTINHKCQPVYLPSVIAKWIVSKIDHDHEWELLLDAIPMEEDIRELVNAEKTWAFGLLSGRGLIKKGGGTIKRYKKFLKSDKCFPLTLIGDHRGIIGDIYLHKIEGTKCFNEFAIHRYLFHVNRFRAYCTRCRRLKDSPTFSLNAKDRPHRGKRVPMIVIQDDYFTSDPAKLEHFCTPRSSAMIAAERARRLVDIVTRELHSNRAVSTLDVLIPIPISKDFAEVKKMDVLDDSTKEEAIDILRIMGNSGKDERFIVLVPRREEFYEYLPSLIDIVDDEMNDAPPTLTVETQDGEGPNVSSEFRPDSPKRNLDTVSALDLLQNAPIKEEIKEEIEDASPSGLSSELFSEVKEEPLDDEENENFDWEANEISEQTVGENMTAAKEESDGNFSIQHPSIHIPIVSNSQTQGSPDSDYLSIREVLQFSDIELAKKIKSKNETDVE